MAQKALESRFLSYVLSLLSGVVFMSDNATGEVSSERLRSFILRIEKLEESKAAVMEDIKDVYGEAKSTGFDVKIIRQIVRLRKIEVEKRREQEELLDLYKSALGMEV